MDFIGVMATDGAAIGFFDKTILTFLSSSLLCIIVSTSKSNSISLSVASQELQHFSSCSTCSPWTDTPILISLLLSYQCDLAHVSSICLNTLLSLLTPLANDMHDPSIICSAYSSMAFQLFAIICSKLHAQMHEI